MLLLTDLYYLDHYGRSAHFPGHAVVLAGYDEELAWVSDTAFEDLQTTSLEGLREARHSQQPIFPLEGHAIDVPDGTQLDRDDLLAHAPKAIERAASRMLEPPLGDFEGLPALRRFAAEVGGWPETAEDWQWCARFLYQVIERRGTGGGNFRRMYARFLEEAGYEAESTIAAEAAEDWTRACARGADRERARAAPSRALEGVERRGRAGAGRRGAALDRVGCPLRNVPGERPDRPGDLGRLERVMPFGALVEELGGEAAMVREYRSWAEALAAAGLGDAVSASRSGRSSRGRSRPAARRRDPRRSPSAAGAPA